MAWNFLKKMVGKEEERAAAKPAPAPAAKPAAEQVVPAQPKAPKAESPKAAKPAEAKAEAPVAAKAQKAAKPAAPADAAARPAAAKSPAEKTDDELAAELDAMSPEILSQAKDPQMRALIIGIYRRMLVDKVDVSDDKAVKKWMQKHPEVLQGGETVKIETVRREAPKVGRNEPCPCGSGKKYKKCCGAGK